MCAREMKDVQLALIVARLVHGPGSAAERSIIERFVLPQHEGSWQEAAQSDASWAAAVGSWLLGDRAACMQALLPWSDAINPTANSLAQLAPALALVAKAKGSRGTAGCEDGATAQLSAVRIKEELLHWCCAASESLQAAGLPAAALQAEAIAAACTASASLVGKQPGNESTRAAWAFAAAMLPHPTGAAANAATATAAFERQLAALRPSGLSINAAEASKRFQALQRAVEPLAHSSSAMSFANLTSSGSVASTAATPRGQQSSGLLRQFSFEGARSTHSTHSVGSITRRASLDTAPGRSRPSSGTTTGAERWGGPLAEGVVVFQVDGDAVHAVCCCPLIAPDVLGRPVVAATARHGLLEFATQAPPPPIPQVSEHVVLNLIINALI